jgi:hypothetical protein
MSELLKQRAQLSSDLKHWEKSRTAKDEAKAVEDAKIKEEEEDLDVSPHALAVTAS